MVTRDAHIAPLVTFRILFGLLMFFSVVRFAWNGWIETQYISPKFFFTYFGFEWVQPIGEMGMYLIFIIMGFTSLGIALGWFYRVSSAVFFILFTYIELIDKTNYLNHYYFVSLVSFLLIWVPAHRWCSGDVLRGAVMPTNRIPIGFINIFRLQLVIVYFYAGIAKINYDWLIRAQPLKMWLAANVYKPIIGPLLKYKITAYAFSWGGMLYDIMVPFLLLTKRTLPIAYVMVVVFHLLTWWLFPIGMFPFIMIGATLIFFPESFHIQVLDKISRGLNISAKASSKANIVFFKKPVAVLFGLYILLQLAFPFRYLLYPGNLFWTEEGYRFSWRVMLMEKAGHVTFHIRDSADNRYVQASNYEYLTPQQEKMMSTQPDMILQFAHFLKDEYEKKGFKNPAVTAEAYVSLNGRPHRLLVDPNVDLAEISEGWAHKNWIASNE
ncbi:MAG: HTTM domain-containing protein [Cyclobacteriaceae bacterium]|nr:HTTM domain-containing protein [Cyclobacteriaceae bacterium HetDA_MAG_MS6]